MNPITRQTVIQEVLIARRAATAFSIIGVLVLLGTATWAAVGSLDEMAELRLVCSMVAGTAVWLSNFLLLGMFPKRGRLENLQEDLTKEAIVSASSPVSP